MTTVAPAGCRLTAACACGCAASVRSRALRPPELRSRVASSRSGVLRRCRSGLRTAGPSLAVRGAGPAGRLVPVPALIATGLSGRRLAGASPHPRSVAGKRRLPPIAHNGLRMPVPCALHFSAAAAAGNFCTLFFAVQGPERAAGALNRTLPGRHLADGLATGRRPRAATALNPAAVHRNAAGIGRNGAPVPAARASAGQRGNLCPLSVRRPALCRPPPPPEISRCKAPCSPRPSAPAFCTAAACGWRSWG